MKLWMLQDGSMIRIEDMTDRHLLNADRMTRSMNRESPDLAHEVARRLLTPLAPSPPGVQGCRSALSAVRTFWPHLSEDEKVDFVRGSLRSLLADLGMPEAADCCESFKS